ncbi:MAG: MFS transporter [Promethearchaeota archaeon]
MESNSESLNIHARTNVLVFVVLMANLIRYIGVSIIQIGLPAFILDLSGSLFSYGLVIGVFNLTQSITQFPMAAFSDKIGRKKMIIIGILIYIIGTFSCFFAQNIIELIIFRAIQGAGAYSSILQAVIGDFYRKEEQGKGMALYSLTISVGYFVGTAMGGPLSFYLGFRSVFLITGIFAIISVILIIVFLKIPKPKIKEKNTNEGTHIKKERITSMLNDIKILFKKKQYQLAILINSTRWLLFGGITSYLTWLIQVHFGLNQIETSYLLIITVAIYTLFLLITGKLVDKHGTKKMILIGQASMVIFGFLFIIVSITNDLMLFIIASLLNAICFGIIQTAGNTLILQKIEEINPNLKGSGIGMGNAIGFLCSAIGPIIISIFGEIEMFLPYYFTMFLIFPVFLLTLKFLEK